MSQDEIFMPDISGYIWERVKQLFTCRELQNCRLDDEKDLYNTLHSMQNVCTKGRSLTANS